MKTILGVLLISSLALNSSFRCERDPVSNENTCLKGQLVIKGICSNYVIKVLQGNIDPTKIKASWTDPATGTVYQNVFALGNPCQFPNDINEGDTFNFQITSKEDRDCVVCQAYRAVPEIKNNITINKTACQ